MKKLIVVTALALLAAVGITWGATAGGSPTSFTDNLYGGGWFAGCSDGAAQFCPSGSREFSIGAVSDPRNRIATGTFHWGNPDGALPRFDGRITCLRTQGKDAVVGGVITDSPNTAVVGLQFSFVVQDNGLPGSATRDRVSAAFIHEPGVDPPADCTQFNTFGSGYFVLNRGDVAVEDH